jgi:hypothetical protein
MASLSERRNHDWIGDKRFSQPSILLILADDELNTWLRTSDLVEDCGSSGRQPAAQQAERPPYGCPQCAKWILIVSD